MTGQSHGEILAFPDGTLGQVPTAAALGSEVSGVAEADVVTPEQWAELSAAANRVILRTINMPRVIDATNKDEDRVESVGGGLRHEYRDPGKAADDPTSWVTRTVTEAVINKTQPRTSKPGLFIKSNPDGSMVGRIVPHSGEPQPLTPAQTYRAAERVVSDMALTLARRQVEYDESRKPPMTTDEELDAILDL